MRTPRTPRHHPVAKPQGTSAQDKPFWDALTDYVNRVIAECGCAPEAHMHLSRADHLIAVGFAHSPSCERFGENCDDHERSAAAQFLLETARPSGRVQ